MPSTTKTGLIRFGVACVLCLSYPVIVYLAFNAEHSVSTAMIVGYVVIVALLLRETQAVAEMIEAWRGS